MSLLEFFSTIFPNPLEQDEYLLLVGRDRATGRLLQFHAEDSLKLTQAIEELRSPDCELFFGLATWRGLDPCRAMAAWIGSSTRAIAPVTLEYPRGVLHCWPFPEPVRCDSYLKAMNRVLQKKYGGVPEFADLRALAMVPDLCEVVQ
jgi:hypothetical protein